MNNESDHNNYKDIFFQLKMLFDGCDTILDAIPLGNRYIEKHPHMKSMILSYMNGRAYKDTIDIKTKQNTLHDTEMATDRDKALSFASKAMDKTNDDVYKKTLERLIQRKEYISREIKPKPKDNVKYINKKCPHCSHILYMPEDTGYVICGYHNPNQGYDWNGCGRDWCFHCGKILCKRWETNSLCLQMNRYHDEDCCSKHAKENGTVYPDDYCQCNNFNYITSLVSKR
jgi:hypothetical protein